MITDAPAHLPKLSRTGASLGLATEPAASDLDVRTSTEQYALSTAGTGTDDEGWLLKTALKTTTIVPGGSDIARISRFDRVTGLPVKSQMPSDAAGTGVGSTVTSYYTAGAHNPAGCISSAWTGLVCTSGPAAQALTGGQPDLPTTRYSYDYLLRPTVLTQTVAGAPDRVSTTTYEQGGLSPRPASSQTTGGEGAVLPATVPHYDSAGRVDSSQFSDGTGALSTGYDDFGRPVRSTDADGFVTTTSYDSHGRPAVLVGKQTLTYGYDSAGTNEHRGMLTSLSASDVSANPFTAGYDADGKLLSQTFPDTLVQTISYDETADPTSLAYRRGSTAVIADDSQLSNIHGQWTHHEGQGSSAEFSYDNAGRLVQVGDRASSVNAGSCTSRSYGYDVDSNRLSSASTPAAADGSCVSTGGASVSHQYDGADRLLPTGPDSGLVYDHYGRTTTLPAASSNQPSPTTAAYYNTDQVKSLSQTVNGTAVTRSWNPDAAGRRRTMTDSAGPAKTSHYSTGGDNPDWIDEGNSNSTTYTTGLGADLAAATTGTATARTTTINLTNLHGDITTTQPLGGGTLGPQQDTDEFGNPHNPTTPTSRYSWLGGKQRSTDTLGGVVLMGVRLYGPALGRFLQVDSVQDGNDNPYDYSQQDPANKFDLNGKFCLFGRSRNHHCRGHRLAHAYRNIGVSYDFGFGFGQGCQYSVYTNQHQHGFHQSGGCTGDRRGFLYGLTFGISLTYQRGATANENNCYSAGLAGVCNPRRGSRGHRSFTFSTTRVPLLFGSWHSAGY